MEQDELMWEMRTCLLMTGMLLNTSLMRVCWLGGYGSFVSVC
jgi:hypothetical protein